MLGILTGNVVLVAIASFRCSEATTARHQQQHVGWGPDNHSCCCRERNKASHAEEVLLTKLEQAQKEHHGQAKEEN
jgi:hypothetical protein